MSLLTYAFLVNGGKELVLAGRGLQTPPMPIEARREIGFLLRLLQDGQRISMPKSRPMPSIGYGCHELRVQAENTIWRTTYFIDADAIVVLEVFAKKTTRTPQAVIDVCGNGCAATTLREERRLA